MGAHGGGCGPRITCADQHPHPSAAATPRYASRRLSMMQVEDFRQHGYVVVDGLVPNEAAARLKAEALRLAARGGPADRGAPARAEGAGCGACRAVAWPWSWPCAWSQAHLANESCAVPAAALRRQIHACQRQQQQPALQH